MATPDPMTPPDRVREARDSIDARKPEVRNAEVVAEALCWAGHADSCASHESGPGTCDCGSDRATRDARIALRSLMDAAAIRAECASDTKRLAAMFKRCSITFYPEDGSYPVEYSPFLHPTESDYRQTVLFAAIDAAMPSDAGGEG